jgi:predicted Zn finger-like uncharacterized protein
MSLATRCPVCQTVFRVVQDQLKVSEGWVRCGRCAKVFNAFEGLFDLEREFPALRSTAGAPGASGTSGTSAAPASSTASQRVLEDLARRNPRPQPSPQWEQEIDARANMREPTPRAPGQQPVAPVARASVGPAAPSTTASAPVPQKASATAPVQASAPVPFKPSAPAPFQASAPAPFKPSAPGPFQPTAAAPFQPSAAAPFQSSAPAPFQPSAPAPRRDPTHASAAARRDAAPPPTFRPSLPAANDDATLAPMTALVPPAATAAASPNVTPARALSAVPATAPPPTSKVATGPPEVEIRAEPAPLAGTAAESGAVDDDSFEALFRSDGELSEPATATDGVDIVLDDSEVEPAALDDAVDSRLLTFVQQAEQAERWRRPWVRAAMALASLLLVLLLAAQIVVARRDAVVAQWPESRALVQALCAPLDCRIEPLRRIEQISVDSSGLTRIDDGPVYRLALVLRNRSDTPLLAPAIDLSLTDASGTLVTRRMLSANELGAARTTIAPQQELPLQALLMSADRPLTGYTIEIFYP